MNEVDIQCGEIVCCTKIHEDELECIEWRVKREKKGAGTEKVNWYEVPGKSRPALVLRACDDPGLRYVIVWYTCSKQRSHCKNKEVTGDIPQERRRGKQTFLNHDPAMIRRVPRKQAWFGDRLAKIDRTVMDGHLKTAMQLPFLVFDSAGRVPCHAADGGN